MDEAARVAPVALDVVVNGCALARSIERSEVAGEAARRGGVMVELGRAGSADVVRPGGPMAATRGP